MCCEILDRDQSFVVQDYGPQGYIGSADIILQHGLQQGAVISVVTNSYEPFAINIKDAAGNILIHVDNRANNNDFGINNYQDGVWGTKMKVNPIPVQKGVRTVTTILYQATGYLVFINGKEIAFFKHRSSKDAHRLDIVQKCQIFKIMYFTVRNIIP